jgi:glycosyltransferase involved in cell wall biosynthesis
MTMTSASTLAAPQSMALDPNSRESVMTTPPAPEFPRVSIVVPCRNEAGFIAKCLDSILANDYDGGKIEILVVDGASDDSTREIVGDYARSDPRIRLLDNPRRITPTALNIGIRASVGEVIIRMDAHNAYPVTYISSLVHWLVASGADNVGGIWITRPSGGSPMAEAIAVGLSHPFGVGNSYFRIGTTEPRWVDNVPFGCYRRSVFERIGLFDEDLVRNQDDELNLRLIRKGGRILLVPSIQSHYHARGSLSKLAHMNFQYGYFKPLVIRKIGAVMTVRQVVPATFVAALAAGLLLSLIDPAGSILLVTLLGTYLTASIVAAAGSVRKHGIRTAAALIAVFPVIHIAYGTGFLRGVLDFFVRGLASPVDTTSIPITR